jgi:coenzyme F420-reducing hydrogenase gamma subunit
MAGKPTMAFFDFTSCEGCQIEFTNLGDEATIELLKHFDLVEFREAMTETTDKRIDFALVEGSFTREMDRDRLIEVRRRAKTVIAYGACACTGGINSLRNHQDDFHAEVYGDHACDSMVFSGPALPISSVIEVDYEVRGCPADKYELIDILSSLLHGKDPVVPGYPVCMECKRRGTVCRYDVGDYCMGQIARAGCGAPCPAAGIPCEACRGFAAGVNTRSLEKVLVERGGMSQARAISKARMFTANQKG